MDMLAELIEKANEQECREAYRLICQRLVNLENQQSSEPDYDSELSRRIQK